MEFVNSGLYTIKDTYFKKFDKGFLSDNKRENRPYYYAVKDKDDIVWFIPLSTQTEAYEDKINKDIKKHGECLFYLIGKINGIKRVFLIGNIFPATKEYVKKPYTVNNAHYVVRNSKLIKEVNKRASKYIALVKQGKLKSNADIMWIYEQLTK